MRFERPLPMNLPRDGTNKATSLVNEFGGDRHDRRVGVVLLTGFGGVDCPARCWL
jgi:hypothetical protein